MPRREDEYAYEQTYDDDEEGNEESNEGEFMTPDHETCLRVSYSFPCISQPGASAASLSRINSLCALTSRRRFQLSCMIPTECMMPFREVT